MILTLTVRRVALSLSSWMTPRLGTPLPCDLEQLCAPA